MKLRFGVLLTSALALVLGGCAASSGAAPSTPTAAPAASGGGQVLAQGERPREDDDTRAAELHLEQAEEAASDAEARTQYQSALDAARAGIQRDSLNPLAYRLAGEALIGLGDYAEADAMLDEAERLRPVYVLETERTREVAWIDRYQAAAPLVNAGDYEQAVEYFEQANAIYQGRPEVMLTMGQVLVQIGEYDRAIENLQAAQAIIESDRINEMNVETQAAWREQAAGIPAMVAQTLVNAQRYEEAATALRELLAEDPGNPAYLQTLGATFIRMDQPDSARAVYVELMAQDGLQADAYYAGGIGFYQTEDYVEAADAFGKAAEASVNDRDAIEMWARSLQLAYPAGEGEPTPPAGALEELRDASERWLELDPFNQNAHLILAQTVNRLGDEARATELVNAIEALPVTMDRIQLQRFGQGGGAVVGALTNKQAPAGTTATLEVTFYAPDGAVVGMETASIQLGEAETSQDFRVDLDLDAYVGGYSYRLVL
ncbi:MAG: tetratricopeptide repeat protein [Longimicrobiales bacterium]|nr:tetratricopeptide repeat protein [Longimicrobiales bacterium]